MVEILVKLAKLLIDEFCGYIGEVTYRNEILLSNISICSMYAIDPYIEEFEWLYYKIIENPEVKKCWLK